MLTLCSVTTRSVQPCVATTVNGITQRRKCCLLPVPPLSPATLDMIFCLWKPLPHLPPSSPPSWSHVYLISALRETCPESHADRQEEGRMSRERLKWSSVFIIDFHPILPALQPPVVSLPSLTFTISDQLSSLTLASVNTTPLPYYTYHLPLHPVTVTTSQPPRSALRWVPLTDTCFIFPLVLPRPKTHPLSASSVQDPSEHPGGGLTYTPSFRTTTSTSCCWRRPGCALPVTRPRSPTWLRLGTRSSSSPALQWGSGTKGGGIAFVIRDSFKSHVCYHFVLSCSAPLLWNRSADSNIQQATNQLVLYLPPCIQQKEQILSFPTFLNTPAVCVAKHFLWVTLTFILKT